MSLRRRQQASPTDDRAGSSVRTFDDRGTGTSIAALASAFCIGGALALMALSATRARAQVPGGPADGAPLMRAPLQAVAPVDLQRYGGRWHEQARLPNRFQKQCASEVTADYALQPDGTIEVRNRCMLDSGKVDESIGEARVVDVPGQPGAGRLEVRFAPRWLSWLPVVWGDYWILKLDRDYRIALVGTPDRKYLWVLSRDARLDDARLLAELEYARTLGFAVDQAIRTDGQRALPPAPKPTTY